MPNNRRPGATPSLEVISHPQNRGCSHKNQQLSKTGSSVIGRFISEFEEWVFDEFRCADRSVEAQAHNPIELVYILRPWIATLLQLAAEGLLRSTAAEEACRLGCLINHAVDRVERHYPWCGESSAIVLDHLPACEDLLVFLALVERGFIGTGGMYSQADLQARTAVADAGAS